MNLNFDFSAASAYDYLSSTATFVVQCGTDGLLWASANPLLATALLLAIPAVNAGLYYATHTVIQYSYSVTVPLSTGEVEFKGTKSEFEKQVKAKIAETTKAIEAEQATVAAEEKAIEAEQAKAAAAVDATTKANPTLNKDLKTLRRLLADLTEGRLRDYSQKTKSADLTGTAFAFLHTAVLTASVAALASAGGAWMLASYVLGAVALPELRKLYMPDDKKAKSTANALSTVCLAGMVGGLPAAGVAIVVEALAFATTFSDKTKRFASVIDDLNSIIAPSTSFVEVYNRATGKGIASVDR